MSRIPSINYQLGLISFHPITAKKNNNFRVFFKKMITTRVLYDLAARENPNLKFVDSGN